MTALADLHSVQKSHVLWKELTFDNVLVSSSCYNHMHA